MRISKPPEIRRADTILRFQLAVLFSIMDGTVEGTDIRPECIMEAIDHVLREGYMTTTEPEENWNPGVGGIRA